MNYKLYFLIALSFINFSYNSHAQKVAGTAFDFNYQDEQDAHFVLADNYNHYMVSVTTAGGLVVGNQMIVRKFDQKNQLLDTYTYNLPKIDDRTGHDYLGSAELSNGKVVTFTQTYSGKGKKNQILKHEFDKATAAFTTTEIVSNTIESLSKRGYVEFQKSQAGNYIGILYKKHRVKNEAEKNTIFVLDSKTLNVVWQKEAEFTNDHATSNFTVTNSGKMVLLRNNASFKKANNTNYLTVVSADAQEDKAFEPSVFIDRPYAISIGTQDYILAFNSNTRGMPNIFSNLMLYDLQQGKVLQNNKLQEYQGILTIADVDMTNILLKNNEIYIFTEPKVKVETKPDPAGSSFMSTGFNQKYTYGPSYLYILSFDGTLKATNPLTTATTAAEFSHSYGVLNIRDTYYLNTGYKPSNYETYSTLYTLNAANNYKVDKNSRVMNINSDAYRYAYQLLHYFADSSSLLTAKVESDNKMSLVTFQNIKLQ